MILSLKIWLSEAVLFPLCLLAALVENYLTYSGVFGLFIGFYSVALVCVCLCYGLNLKCFQKVSCVHEWGFGKRLDHGS